MSEFNLTIDGAAINTGETLDVINPSNGEPFAQCPLANPALVDQAVNAARRAFPQWSATSDEARNGLIHQLGQLLEQHQEELETLICQETGKPRGGLNFVGATMELMGSIGWTHVTADITLADEIIQDDDELFVKAYRKPLGVVASITPWNWPLMIAIWHVIPALRAGNTVVIKPSEKTPLATLRFVELANTVLPKGVLNIVTGYGDVGGALVAHPEVNKIIFTGSTPTGKAIMASAATSLKRLTLELGGNDAAIVLPDIDINSVVPQLFGAAFHNNGQTCACLKRLYVHESIYDEVCQALAEQAKAVVVGDALNADSQLGPLQNEEQLNIVVKLAASATKAGGQILAGGKRIGTQGFFFEPTIVAGLSNGDELVDEEQFGPILPVIKYTDIDSAIALANDNPNGLGGSVWSADIQQAEAIAQQLECGTSWVNTHGAVQPDAPFGGTKQSGFGVEFGAHGLAEYTSLHTLKIQK
ncbi:aldehyde dehydrogenase family protein [Amphritea sp.]|uniref:aldehyde dehydrogenase family protein n=1 Tax=Amphritea sp. TaxID=1872502 RepID=UPI003A8F1895